MPDLQMRFDLRVPPFAPTTFARQYAAFLEMVRWADEIGVASVSVSEHHGDVAGYMPAPITLAAAVLASTSRLRVSISAALAPLHDPVRLAEQLATVDNLGPGRLSVIIGAGYRQVEFDMAGVAKRERGRLVEECVTVLRAAWTGEPFEWRGRTVLVTPPPATPGGPTLLLGGKTEVAARRAARLRCSFSPASGDRALADAYRAECQVVGYAGSVEGLGDRPVRPGFVMVAKDAEAVWQQIAPYALYDAQTYAGWQDDAVRSDWVVPDLVDAESLRSSGRYLVVTPEECVDLVTTYDGLVLHPLMGGISPELAWESLHLLEHEVLPAVGWSR
jgi:alkanesulfonate monooxygenase SsuD/methylene tetrahydromethanopterin reductase-like flavin-dependent oxidoreductase (luciferase family)